MLGTTDSAFFAVMHGLPCHDQLRTFFTETPGGGRVSVSVATCLPRRLRTVQCLYVHVAACFAETYTTYTIAWGS